MSGSSAPRRAELTVPVDVNAPAEAVWHTLTDWPGQAYLRRSLTDAQRGVRHAFGLNARCRGERCERT